MRTEEGETSSGLQVKRESVMFDLDLDWMRSSQDGEEEKKASWADGTAYRKTLARVVRIDVMCT